MKLRMCLVSAGLLLVGIIVGSTRPIEAIGGCIPGSYLAVEDSGTRSLWTFFSDGTFTAASSAQGAFNFSQIQGTWQRDGVNTSHAVALDFGFRSEPIGAGVPPQWITRIDASLEFARDCQQFAGEFELRFYSAGEDPLDATAVVAAGGDTLTGLRINVR